LFIVVIINKQFHGKPIDFMGFAQYHEPAEEISQDVRTFARMIKPLIEEAESID
jgi:hypothetical protein